VADLLHLLLPALELLCEALDDEPAGQVGHLHDLEHERKHLRIVGLPATGELRDDVAEGDHRVDQVLCREPLAGAQRHPAVEESAILLLVPIIEVGLHPVEHLVELRADDLVRERRVGVVDRGTDLHEATEDVGAERFEHLRVARPHTRMVSPGQPLESGVC
jgi:hypothetical protein